MLNVHVCVCVLVYVCSSGFIWGSENIQISTISIHLKLALQYIYTFLLNDESFY